MHSGSSDGSEWNENSELEIPSRISQLFDYEKNGIFNRIIIMTIASGT